MPRSTLLAELATRLARSPEDIATSALELLLGRSAAARATMDRLIREWSSKQSSPVVRWAAQVGGGDNARTDLQGYSSDERTVVILENKFWAGLTDNQPRTYLERLADPGDATLVFVVPSRRVPLIAVEVARRLCGGQLGFVISGECQLLAAEDGKTIVVAAWSTLLGSIEQSMEAAGELENLLDLRQLTGLVERVEQDGFYPLTITDLTGDTPKLLLQLCKLVDACIEQVLGTRPYADKRNLKATAGKGWYGHYFRIYGFGCRLSFNAWWWEQRGASPVWLTIANSAWGFPEGLRGPLGRALGEPDMLVEERGYDRGLWLPIRLAEGQDFHAVVREMVAQLDVVAGVLENYPRSDEGATDPVGGDEALDNDIAY